MPTKIVRSEAYNYNFNMENGNFARWGKTLEDDPEFSPIGPEILDMEISTVCHQGCSFCYKTNVAEGQNMSLETFQEIFHKIPRNLTQIAFGIGSLGSCPDLYKIMEYCRNNDYNTVVPNLTINGASLTDEHAAKLVSLAGAIAVSRYNPDTCYDAVEKLTSLGLEQVNIHQLLSEDTYETCLQVIDDVQNDPRLGKLKAVVFLLMKPKGHRNVFKQLRSAEKYKALVDKAFAAEVAIGFDSCSAPQFIKSVKGRDNFKDLEMCAEPCESTRFSTYVDVNGDVWPCSFCEGHPDPDISPVSLLGDVDFMKDVWGNEKTKKFREKLRQSKEDFGCEHCPAFDLEMS